MCIIDRQKNTFYQLKTGKKFCKLAEKGFVFTWGRLKPCGRCGTIIQWIQARTPPDTGAVKHTTSKALPWDSMGSLCWHCDWRFSLQSSFDFRNENLAFSCLQFSLRRWLHDTWTWVSREYVDSVLSVKVSVSVQSKHGAYLVILLLTCFVALGTSLGFIFLIKKLIHL